MDIPAPSAAAMLTATGLTKQFGGLRAVDDVSLEVRSGEILGLLGPNGAGKTTIFQMLSGFERPTAGEITLLGHRIERADPVAICRLGLARTFQIVEVFPTLTVGEALAAAAFARASGAAAREKAREIGRTIGLDAKFDVVCSDLTLAEQKTLEIGKAIATGPKIVLLDEVMAGLRPTEAQEVVGLIRRLRDGGITFLLVEHIMDVIMALADRIVVIAAGRKIAEGEPRDVVANPEVIDVYLGREIDLA